MTARTKLEKYPIQFQQLTERAMLLEPGEDGTLMKIKLTTRGQAVNLMLQIRQYWNAVAAAVEKGEITEYDPRYKAGLHAAELACRAMKSNPATIEILRRTHLAGAKAIQEAMDGLEAALEETKAAVGSKAVPVPQKPMSQEDLLADTYTAKK